MQLHKLEEEQWRGKRGRWCTNSGPGYMPDTRKTNRRLSAAAGEGLGLDSLQSFENGLADTHFIR